MVNKKSKYFLGVDGGATQNKAVIINEDGKILGTGKSGGVNHRVVGLESLIKNLQRSLLVALQEARINPPLAFAIFGLAGCDSEGDQKILQEAISRKLGSHFSSFLVVNDTRIALRSVTEEPFGLVVIAGTGSNIYGRNRKGEEALAGGLDYLLSDEGSAYDIGLKVLRAAVRSFDGREEKSFLEEMVRKKLGVLSLREAVDKVYQPTFDKAEVASFAPLAEEATRLGDKKAREILLTAAWELSLGAKAVIEKLGMREENFSLALIGAVFKSKIVLEKFQEEVFKFTPQTRLTFPKMPPAQAAAFLAREEYAKIKKEVKSG